MGFIHTLLGPDHYLPFIMIGRARNWSIPFLLFVTVSCGIGHVLGSVILGFAGIFFGISLGFLENIEAARGNLAGWFLIGIGIAYAVWGIRYSIRRRKHIHPHSHDNDNHQHSHNHLGGHTHIHGDLKTVTPWALFIIFVLGPCEPLIPLLMYPASKHGWLDLALVTLSFGFITILTMSSIVFLLYKGSLKINLGFLERHMHATAGIIIAISGILIKVFEL